MLGAMRCYGLIGFPLGHSVSPRLFETFFRTHEINARYDLYPMEDIVDLRTLVSKKTALRGLNVTIPHKVSVMNLLDEIAPEAAKVGAVNTIKIERDGVNSPRLIGYNTDIVGFRLSILPLIKEMKRADSNNVRSLILGSGGAACAVGYVLQDLGIKMMRISRTASSGDLTYAELNEELIKSHRIIINTTPMGMYPAISAAPELPYEAIDSSHLCYDLIYNPYPTAFLSRCADRGATICGGAQMLSAQAFESYRIWTESEE